MVGKANKNLINGWLVLDKPEGITSNSALGAVKRLLNPKKAGHAGTLDPLATGILPIALGDATKVAEFVLAGRKGYEFTIKWGIETDSDDANGNETARSQHIPAIDDIARALKMFTGKISQMPPRFSALKINGQRAYKLAREGKSFELKCREVEVYDFCLLKDSGEGETSFTLECGKGVYVRSLARDLGRHLNSFGHVCRLRRTAVGAFSEQDAVTLDRLQQLTSEGIPWLKQYLKPVASALDGVREYPVDNNLVFRIKNGQNIIMRDGCSNLQEGDMVRLMCRNRLIGLAAFTKGKLHPKKIFCT